MQIAQLSIVGVILMLALYVALRPNVVYAPQPRIVLYFLLSVLLSVFAGSEAVAKLKLELPGFCFVSGGATAVSFACLWFLDHLSKPEEKIAVFRIYDESNNPVDLQWHGAIDVPITDRGLQITTLTSGNAAVLIFPEQVGQAEMHIRKTSTGPVYSGLVSYAGSRTARLQLGSALRLAGTPSRSE